MCEDTKHHLYIATHNGFYRLDEGTGTCKHFLLPHAATTDNSFQIIHRCMLGNDGDIWMTSWHAGLIQFNPQNESIKEEWLNKKIYATQYKTAFDILQADDKNLWVANDGGGLSVFNTLSDSTINYPVKWDDEKNYLMVWRLCLKTGRELFGSVPKMESTNMTRTFFIYQKLIFCGGRIKISAERNLSRFVS